MIFISKGKMIRCTNHGVIFLKKIGERYLLDRSGGPAIILNRIGEKFWCRNGTVVKGVKNA